MDVSSLFTVDDIKYNEAFIADKADTLKALTKSDDDDVLKDVKPVEIYKCEDIACTIVAAPSANVQDKEVNKVSPKDLKFSIYNILRIGQNTDCKVTKGTYIFLSLFLLTLL